MAQVSVTTKLPATVAPGGSFTVELKVAKADVSGFAKLQQQLPPGFNAEAGEIANSTFSFKEQKVKFLWMALPANDFTVSYKVTVDASLSGNQIIDGTFAYIKDNETEKFVIPKDIITVGADGGAGAQQAAMDKILADQKAKDEAADAARKEAAPEPVVTNENPKVEKTEVVEATEKPAAETVDNSAEEAKKAEDQKKADEAQKAAEAKQAADAKKAEDARKADEAKQAAEAKKAEKAAAAPVAAATPDYNDAMMKSKPGLVFRVQIAAGPNKVDPALFKTKYGINDAVVIEEHEGLVKYVVGEFGSYRPAKTFSNELRDNNKVEGPFVTAYKDGVRIHVKEALDLAGQ